MAYTEVKPIINSKVNSISLCNRFETMHLRLTPSLVSAILQVPIIKTSKNKNLQSEMELTFYDYQ